MKILFNVGARSNEAWARIAAIGPIRGFSERGIVNATGAAPKLFLAASLAHDVTMATGRAAKAGDFRFFHLR
jgi:hypothetical protein